MSLSFIVYLISLIIILRYTALIFLIALKKKDNSIIDIAYGPAFIVAAYILAGSALIMSPVSPYTLIILSLITVWGIRLSVRIYHKNKAKGEDFRYKLWRDSWSKKGVIYFYSRSYLQIFVIQGVVVSVVLLPFTLTLLVPHYTPLDPYVFAGIAIWCAGFIFETLGDKQLDAFLAKKTGGVMKTGLWKYTRHPNYFGEATMWVGISVIALFSGTSFIVLLSPLLITSLLLFVSGIPMIEKKWEGNEEWETYKKKTSPFLPLPPRR